MANGEVVLGYKIENESRSKINEALKEVGNIQDKLFDLREELFRLQSENQELSQQLKAQKELENRRNQYQLEQTPGRAMVYVSLGNPKHYACPVCFNKGDIQVLQGNNVEGFRGTYDCYNCKAVYVIEPDQQNEQHYARDMWDPRWY